MDKVIFKDGDVERLLEWRDENKDLVRRMPMPCKALQLVFTVTDISIKCIRQSRERVVFQVNERGRSLGALKIDVLETGGYAVRQKPKSLNEDNVMTVVTVYSSLMALMTYGDGVDYTPKELEVLDSVVETKKLNKDVHTQQTRRQPSITYLLNRGSNGRLSVGGKGTHASPKGEFRVRGHFRHYANGDVVWIAEYKKGTGKRRVKVYRI